MENLILVKIFNKENKVVTTEMVENLMTAKSSLASSLDGWDTSVEYGTTELILFLNIKQF